MALRIISICMVLVLVAAAGCTGSSTSQQQNNSGNFRVTNSTYDSEVNSWQTPFFAGAGQGWPATGENAGTVKVWNSDTHLFIKVVTSGDWTLGHVGDTDINNNNIDADDAELHIDVIVGDLPDSNPGGFPWQVTNADGETSYEWSVLLAGDYPDHGRTNFNNNDQNPDNNGPYTYNFAGELLDIAVHGVACIEEEGTDPTDDSCGRSGDIASIGLYAGADDENVGTVDLSVEIVDGVESLVVTTTVTDECAILDNVHMYIGLEAPESLVSAYGPASPPRGWQNQMLQEWNWGPFMSPNGLNSMTYTFTVPLSTFAEYLPDCGADCSGDAVSGWYFALHASADPTCEDGNDWSATAWDPACRTRFIGPNGKPHFKSYDFCSLVFPDCVFTPGDPGSEGGLRCETAWGFDMSSSGEDDSVSKNEDGWFETYFSPLAKWGWVFLYTAD